MGTDKNVIEITNTNGTEDNFVDTTLDTNRIREEIAEMIEFINRPEIKELKARSIGEYNWATNDHFQNFKIFKDVPALYNKVMKGDDINELYTMLKLIEDIRDKKESKSAVPKYGETLMNKYSPGLKDALVKNNMTKKKKAY
jgi:uncharacterized protein YktA (UPF0223 family)